MVDSPLIRPYLLGGRSFGGGGLDSHDQLAFWNFLKKNVWLGDFFHRFSRWWFQTFFIFTTDLGKSSNLTIFFQMGWNHQLVLHEFLQNVPRSD